MGDYETFKADGITIIIRRDPVTLAKARAFIDALAQSKPDATADPAGDMAADLDAMKGWPESDPPHKDCHFGQHYAGEVWDPEREKMVPHYPRTCAEADAPGGKGGEAPMQPERVGEPAPGKSGQPPPRPGARCPTCGNPIQSRSSKRCYAEDNRKEREARQRRLDAPPKPNPGARCTCGPDGEICDYCVYPPRQNSAPPKPMKKGAR